jgi:hypothetical protein
MVLFVSVAVPVSVATVPDVGNVTSVGPVALKVILFPIVVKLPAVLILPPNVIVLDPLSTPVPPYIGSMIVAFQVPVVTVPSVTKSVLPSLGRVAKAFRILGKESCSMKLILSRYGVNISAVSTYLRKLSSTRLFNSKYFTTSSKRA